MLNSIYSFDSPLRSQELSGGSTFLAAGGWVPCFLAHSWPEALQSVSRDRCATVAQNDSEKRIWHETAEPNGFVTCAYYGKQRTNHIQLSSPAAPDQSITSTSPAASPVTSPVGY